ncbi:hypothetical protein EV182_003913 [Spiromyces aspiralis]|uniref:Uncharacterized protein n=1 Tax=Spiromyces aspiralis TaxID=68401 RepID=A0ACC1HT48_9FUNG|nr:hypothetical protein EV182_003913 [Spiromyces aspiralis]
MSEEESDVSLHKEQGMDGIHTIKGRKQVGGDDGSEPGSGTDSETESKHDLPINDAGMAAHQQHPYAGGAKNRSWKDIGNASAPRSRRSSNAGTSVMSVDTAASAAVTNGSGGNLKTLATPTSQQKSSLSAKQVAPLAQQLSDTDRSEQNVATGKPRAASAIITTTVGKAAEVKPADGQDKGSGKHKATARKEEEEEEEETKPLPLHPPTQCPCDIQGHAHYENTALDEVFPVSMPVLFRLVFSEVIVPPDVDAKHGVTDPELIKQLSGWMRALLEKQGMRELKIKPWSLPSKPNESESQEYNYIRPLNFSIGPKQTNVTQTFAITTKDFERAVVVEGTVKTPDVPSGSSFYVKTRSCLSWAAGANGTPPGGCTRLRVTFKIEWTKSSWIKGAVEKGTIEGNKTTYSSLKTELLKWIEEHPQLTVRSTVEKRPHRRPKSPEERRATTAPAEVAETGELARRRRRYTPFIKEKPEVESPKELVEVGRRAAENEAEEEADRQGLLEATRSWNGWLRYHVIRPFSRLGLGYTKRKILGEGDIRERGVGVGGPAGGNEFMAFRWDGK